MLLYCLHIAHVLKWNSDISYTCSLFKMASFRKQNVENHPSKYATIFFMIIVWSYLVIRLFFVYDQCFGKLFLFQCEIEMDECKQRLKLNWHYSKWNSDQIIQYKSVWTKINIHTPCDADIFHKPFTQTNKSNKFKLFCFLDFQRNAAK